MRVFGIILIFLSLLSCQSTDTANFAYDHDARKRREITPMWPESGPILREIPASQVPTEILCSDEFADWTRNAAEAATSATAWSRFGEERLIEWPYNVDPTQIRYQDLGKDCVTNGRKLTIKNDANSGCIKFIFPTDQQSACAFFIIEIVVARESGEVLDMKDSFVESNALFPALIKKEKTENGSLTRRIDAPVRNKTRLFE
jgi:hypothetical protein